VVNTLSVWFVVGECVVNTLSVWFVVGECVVHTLSVWFVVGEGVVHTQCMVCSRRGCGQHVHVQTCYIKRPAYPACELNFTLTIQLPWELMEC